MKRTLAQTRKEITQILRDRLALALVLVLPVMILILLGSAISLTVNHLPIVVQDYDDSSASHDLIDAFRASNSLYVIACPPNKKPEESFSGNKARAALVIPEHFERDIVRGASAPVQFLVDGSDANTAALVAGDADRIVRAYNAATSGAATLQPVRAEIRLWYNPGVSSKKYSGPGVFVLAMSMFPPLLASLAMAKEGEKKTILQVYVSNISAHEYLLGKIIAFTLVGLAESVPLLILLTSYFGLSFAGDPTAFIAATVLYTFCVASFGTMVGSLIPSRVAAMQAVALGGFLLVFLLSGLIFPIENIPTQIRWVSDFVWGKYYIHVVRDAFLQGGGWRSTWFDVAVIGFIGLVFYSVTWKTMRRMQVRT
ncbi:MAG: ABC transporter permease [Acidobacteriaceae bacterium]|nr:ABC transporter permease [Acidobacteriaceae bacterium]MBV9782053.1 ABC transporter permease [Acidobacteriaceae bacterium]